VSATAARKIDAVLLDIYMPKLIRGREARSRTAPCGLQCDVPVVVCSGFVIDPDEFMILSQGHPPPVDIMLKPYSLDGLSKALAKAVELPKKGRDTVGRETAPSALEMQPVLVA
jgi:two-component system cell cycle sensor histidine kinase/response regulator CckA